MAVFRFSGWNRDPLSVTRRRQLDLPPAAEVTLAETATIDPKWEEAWRDFDGNQPNRTWLDFFTGAFIVGSITDATYQTTTRTASMSFDANGSPLPDPDTDT